MKNIDILDRYIRLTAGISLVTFGAVRYGKTNSLLSKLLVMAGAMTVAEGITGYCPLLAMMEKKPKKKMGIF